MPHPGPKPADLNELLFYERAWTNVFRGLRDGSPETEEEILGGRGVAIFVKQSSQDREKLFVFRSGEKPLKRSTNKALSASQEWRAIVRKEEKEFEKLETGQKVARVRHRAIPGEPRLWEALKRAHNAAELRRICRRSKHWLKWEWSGEIEGRHWYQRAPSACPKALYDHAQEFCQAKRDERYPASDRPSSDDKRIEYLARVMAGLSLPNPIRAATAVGLLRKMKH